MKAVVEGAGFRAHLIDATGGAFPYVLIVPAYERAVVERDLEDATGDIDADVRVTSVGANGDAAMGIRGVTRSLFSPAQEWQPLDVPGRVARLRFLRHEMTAVDRDTTVTGSNTHPVYAVDTYRLVSQPA